MSSCSLDTNIALRIVLHDVPEQFEKITKLIRDSKPGSLAISDVVFFECAWILAGKMYKLDRALIGKLLLQVAAIPQINCNRALLERAIPLYVKHSKISFIDACLATYAELNNAAPLMTFDEELVKALPKAVASL